MKRWLGVVIALCVTVAGLSTLAAATHGFDVWTEEGQRRWNAMHNPAPLPAFEWRNQSLARHDLESLKKPIVLLDFVYTRCPTVCQLMGYEFKQMQKMLAQRKLQDSVELLSISFDGEYDTPAKMSDYLQRYQADTKNWQAGVIEDQGLLSSLLDHLGVVVLADGQGGFVHNAAFYLIYDGKLVSIHDQNQLSGLLGEIETLSWSF